MKKNLLALSLSIISFLNFGQQLNMDTFNDLGLIEGQENDLSAELKKTKYKQYHSLKFNKADISGLKDQALLRYNMYQDEMEFIKSNKIYFLKKKVGIKVNFIDEGETYAVYNLKGKPNYFKVLSGGEKASALVKESVRMIKAKKAQTSYDTDKPAKWDREEDEYFLTFDNTSTVEIPRRKKDFYDLFKSDSGKINSYMKKNKLSHKDKDELAKIISYYNTL